ncbi:capping protein-inhibiting regulator of actin dynamics isoform X3 [Haemorhous mexicanus]|uniref:capping protein-inhibiting regulator of actin dynamics isoform X3 n=1 Tax=Haemorhous mexicanus TaxID=30427 RepID=UPI0028BEEAF6|nr:capping protein-inhibiting regulator of actin dynamics isoform X3 [Haemorhous mexicanus]
MGSRAFSHDSIFIPDGRTESEQAIQAMSQENVLGKVKILQQQLAKNIKFRQPPQMTISARTMGEANASTEDDALLSSPMETESQQDTVISDCSNKSTDTPDFLRKMNFLGTGYEMEEKVTPMKSARPKRQFSCSGTIETINLDSVPQALARLDNSAAKHKLSVKPKKQRMSRQHKRLTKGSQSLTITEFEPEDLETQLYEDIYPGYNGRFTADKLIQDRDEQKQLQLAEEKRIEDHWGILEAERIRQIVEMEEQREMEEKRCQELEEMRKEQEKERCEEDRRQHLLDEETLKIEEQTCHKDERRLMKAEKKQELEEQMQKELEEQQRQNLEKKRHWEAEEQQRRELEEQKLKEQQEQRQELEEQKLKEQEEQRQELEVQKLKEQEEHQRRELDGQRHQQREEQQRLKQEEEKNQEQREQQRRELEERKHLEQEEQRRQELEGEKHQEWEEQKHKDLEEKERQELEEQKRLEPKELKQHRTEKDSQKEEERNWLEEQTELKKENKEEIQQQELEEKEFEEVEIKLKREKEPESLKQEKKQEEQRQHLKEKEKTEKEQSQQVTDKKKKREEQRKHKLTKQMHMESSDCVLQDELKQQKEQNGHEQKVDTEGQNLQPKQEKSLEQPQEKDQLCSAGGAARHPAEEKFQEGSSFQKVKQPEKGTKTAEEILAQKLKKEVEAQEQKRIGEELRWQEVDERQMSSRPFTFQVSSGDKQIIFQKVNLSPVMPIKGAGLSSPSVKDCRVHTTSKGSHSLPSSVCVPHTAILVTGAQLCGTAVNLNQIKDTACKSLLGLTEERKNVDIPSPEKSERKKQDPKPSSSKMKHAQEALNNQAVLAEWASIRSRILKNAENNKYNERDRVTACRHSDDWTPRGRGAPHGNLRKTLSANAKFSITPAWQKFSDISKTSSDAENVNVTKGNETVAVGRTTGSSADSKEDVVSTVKDNLTEKPKEKMETHREVTDNTEGCKFAKDLPSFLVPSFPHSMGKELPQPELPNALENQQSNSTKKADKPPPNGEENVSPFGIKLRRTNYSLRFHYDQQAEQKKKKRYSAGDSFDGVPDPITSTEGEKESSVFTPQESTSPGTGRANIPGNLKESSVTVVEFSAPVGTPVVPPATGQSVLPAHEKPACKSLVPQKPALAPKPTSQTPPSSPLSKMNRSNLSEMLGQRVAKAESDGGWRKEDKANAAQPVPSNDYKNEEEEVKEKKSFFPSLSIPWREKNDKKPEPLKKEKPVLQSRHSVDGSKLLEKVETSQPLWITLALQKQKGFREQQATREERRQAREAKQAEKLAKENAAVSNQSDNKSSSSKTSTLQKSTTQEGEKKIETAVSRLERREHLKKSNTLPTSVTVEISDSVPTTPVTKEVAKRFSTPDANPVSTEPAWLALAKRKAKAWSDCPQIIK